MRLRFYFSIFRESFKVANTEMKKAVGSVPTATEQTLPVRVTKETS
jgi:hypothetical protein